MSKSEEPSLFDMAMEFAKAYQAKHGKPPMILGEGMELYEHFGESCRITHASEWEVTVQARFGDVANLEPDELKLRYMP